MAHTDLSFDDISNALLNVDSMSETAEAHGTLCGLACISGEASLNTWLTLVFEGLDTNNLLLQESQNILKKLHNQTLEKLASPSYDLNILIHNDDEPLDVRIDDLSLWCQGFLYGLSMAGLSDIKSLPVDASEILQDMSDISKVGYNQDEDEDSNEAAFAEILEYVRIGVYVVYNTFNSDDAAPDSITVH